MRTLYAGLDVADKTTAICVLTVSGEILLETSAVTEPEVLRPYRRMLEKVACESGNKSMWLARELLRKKWPVVCLDARYTHKALAASGNKTDANDARGIASVVSRGIYRTTFIHTDAARTGRAILAQRLSLVRKRVDLQKVTRGVLKHEGGKIVREDGQLIVQAQPRRKLDASLRDALTETLSVAAFIHAAEERLNERILGFANADPVCRRLMTVPGIGALTAFAFRVAIDDPDRFSRSRDVPAYFGLTPRTIQSGESKFMGSITKLGDPEVRSLLYQAGGVILNIYKKPWRLRDWTRGLAEKRGHKVAAVACARRLTAIMHRMWVTGRDSDPES